MYNMADDGEPCLPVLTGCLIVGNVADGGCGAIANSLARPTLTNCTVADNSRLGGEYTSCIWYGGRTTMTNCVVWNPDEQTQSLTWSGGNPGTSGVTVAYCNILGGWPGTGNVNADPCFVAPGHWDWNGTPDDPNDDAWVDGDYHLLPDSLCIDAGDPNVVADLNKPESDVYGGPRFTGGRIDMGADEYSKYDGGSGEPNDPYQIWSAEAMNQIGLHEEDWDKHLKLMADIDLSAFDGKDGRPAFNIVAPGWQTPFTGAFDGNGHTISNLRYTSADGSCVGLFGRVEGPEAQIRNVGLTDPNVAGTLYVGSLVGRLNGGAVTRCHAKGARVIGQESVGGLVGSSSGLVTDCHADATVEGHECVGGLVGGSGEGQATIVGSHATGVVKGEFGAGGLVGANREGMIRACYAVCTVSGENGIGGLAGENGWRGGITACYAKGTVSGKWWVGGLVAKSEDGDTIVDCYSTAEAVGDRYVGGLIGETEGGTIRNCYSTGRVTASLEWGGGFLGLNDSGHVTACFWDTQTSDQSTSRGATGKTTAEMQTQNTFTDAGWDFAGETDNGTEDIWWIDEGKDHPRLWWEKYGGGSGTAEDPFQIWTPEQMNAVGAEPNDWDRHFKLMADIDLSAYTGTRFNMIGRWVGEGHPDNKAFTGVFDGNGMVIRHFTWSSTDRVAVGLFANVDGAGDGGIGIKDLGVENVDIQVENATCVGALAARVRGTAVSNCHMTGSVRGKGANKFVRLRGVGGLIGVSRDDEIVDCHAVATVEGDANVGGLVGRQDSEDGCTERCSSCCLVSGKTDVGGLIGIVTARVRRCYSISVVSGESYVGGLAGIVGYEGRGVSDSYAQGQVTGMTRVGGLAGSTSCDADDCEELGRIIRCYSTCRVQGLENEVGGLVGFHRGAVESSYWDIQASEVPVMCGGGRGCDRPCGRTTAEMQTAQTFLDTGWDFVGETANGTDDIWKIAEGLGYPRLAWQKYSGGTGEPNDPYQIATAANLIALGETPEDYDKHFILTADVDLDPNLPGRKVFDKAAIAPDTVPDSPFSFDGTPFTGVFDGNDYTIWRLTVKGANYLGLFGQLKSEAKIKDLGVVDVNIMGSGRKVGGLAALNGGEVINCHSTGAVKGHEEVGGLVGRNAVDCSVTQCSSSGVVSGEFEVGGLVGWNGEDASVKRCSSSGVVNGGRNKGGLIGWPNVGGLVGYNNEGTVEDCHSSSAVSGGWMVGGLVGLNDGPVRYSYSTGAVSGEAYIGGLTGRNDSIVSNCYSTGPVDGGRGVGGLAGGNSYSAVVSHSYSTGVVTGNEDIGGLVGDDYFHQATGCFWDIQTSGHTISAGGTGKTTAEMQTASTFRAAGWHFVGKAREDNDTEEEIWWIGGIVKCCG